MGYAVKKHRVISDHKHICLIIKYDIAENEMKRITLQGETKMFTF